ncbi:MAG: hypothetical protein KDH96_10965 [Candidatus Riesia sp.]|nr:hypothetical protein [Candidatus Riesia sp.]
MDNHETRQLSIVFDDEYYGRVTADMDDVMLRYKESQYDHLRYHLPVKVIQEGVEHYFVSIKALFLGSAILDMLGKHGVPEAFVDKPTPQIVGLYNDDVVNRFEADFGGGTGEVD